MHEAFPPRLFASSATSSLHSAVIPPAGPSLLVGLSAMRHPANFEHQLKALYRRGCFDRPLTRQPDTSTDSSNCGIRSPVGHSEALQSDATSAYDQLLMQAATGSSQPPQQSESACHGFDGLAVISFQCLSVQLIMFVIIR